MRTSNPLIQQSIFSGRSIQLYAKPSSYETQSGNGILAKIKAFGNKLKNAGQKMSDSYGSELGTQLRNMIPDSDENARPGFPGEQHAILKLPNGKNGVANYMGPGTEVVKRVKRKDPGRTPADYIAKAHDLRYSLAKNTDDIRDADVKMVQALNRTKDAPRNIMLGKRLIQAKMAAEDAGLLSRDKFADGFKQPPPADAAVLKRALSGMEMEGYGGCKKKRKMCGGFLGISIGIIALLSSLSSAASAAMATGIPAAIATGAASAAGGVIVSQLAGKGFSKDLQTLVKNTKVNMNDLSIPGQIALKKGHAFLKENPASLRQVVQVLAPYFKLALAKKVKKKLGQRGNGLSLAGTGPAMDKKITQMAMKKLSVQ